MSQLHSVCRATGPSCGAVVFVHGLGGDAFGTWRNSPRDDDFWPAWLGQDLTDIDIWTLAYEASPSSWLGYAMGLPDRAENVLAWFEAERLQQQNLVFVAHSLGGLVVKQMLRVAAERPGTPAGRILEATQGVAFLGTPNTGSDLASLMDRLRLLLGATAAIRDLEAGSPYLRDLNIWYREHGPAEGIGTLVFAETRAMKGAMVVEQASADPGIPGVRPIPVDADHISIVKPRNRDDLVYKLVRQFVRDRLPAAPATSGVPAPGGRGRRFFISYRRRAADDARLAHALHEALVAAGHDVFIDVQMTIGTEWASRIANRIDWCEFLVVLLSADSVESEMVQEEVRLAYQRRKLNGTPFILPVRVGYQGPLGYALGAYIERLQYAAWNGTKDTQPVIAQILQAAGGDLAAAVPPGPEPLPPWNLKSEEPLRPSPAADPRLLKEADAALAEDDPAYIARPLEQTVLAKAARIGMTFVFKAPRQNGKTTLLIRYLAECNKQGKRTAFVDFQIFDAVQLQDIGRFLTRFARAILRELALDPSLHKPLSAPDEMTDFMEDVVFAGISEPIALGLDEVDCLIARPWREDFFKMLRHWHNLRARRPRAGWARFDLALVVATEPMLLITDEQQSPFNVVEPMRLRPFERHDLGRLNQLYGALLDDSALTSLLELVGGQPYLSRSAFFHLATENGLGFTDFVRSAPLDGGPYGEHLRAKFSELARHDDLVDAYRALLRRNVQPSSIGGYRLEALGLVRRDDRDRFVPACLLYAQYFGHVL